jgi:proteasome accessory factor C
VRAEVADGASPELLARAGKAVADHRRVHLRYLVPGRDETTERDVDPMRVLLVDGRWYLEGWCRRAEDVRLFRMDRVEALTVLETPADVPAAATERDLEEGLFRPSEADRLVSVQLAPPAHWVVDYYPVEEVVEDGDTLLVRLRVIDDGWLRKLALRLGGALRVLDPPELSAAVTTAARDALAAYDRL